MEPELRSLFRTAGYFNVLQMSKYPERVIFTLGTRLAKKKPEPLIQSTVELAESSSPLLLLYQVYGVLEVFA